ncbi:MAG: tetratricopeptide repeat protein [Thermoanaerobaculia bacterium]
MTIKRSDLLNGRRPPARVAVLAALAGLCVCIGLSGCSSTPKKDDFKGQKKFGAEMARKGFWREARFRFEIAASLRPDDAEIQNDLAVSYESLGETARALTAYKRALELAPNESHIKRNYARFAEYYTSVQRAAAPATRP